MYSTILPFFASLKLAYNFRTLYGRSIDILGRTSIGARRGPAEVNAKAGSRSAVVRDLGMVRISLELATLLHNCEKWSMLNPSIFNQGGDRL